MNKSMYKYEELAQYYREYILENGQEWADEHRNDLHSYAFNENAYIIGTYKAKQWLADKVYEVIEIIRAYEQDNFGKVNTDFSSPEKVVNMYVYIIGEYVVNDITFEDIFATNAIFEELLSIGDDMDGSIYVSDDMEGK